MTGKYQQGNFKPTHPEKYAGNPNNIVFRSSWEKKFQIWADTNPSVLKWSSEELVVDYISPIDRKNHRYFIDFVVQVKTRTGKVKNYAVEVKPEIQTLPPRPRKRTTKAFINELQTYAVNRAKWQAADEHCQKNGMDFIILTEKHLFNGK